MAIRFVTCTQKNEEDDVEYLCNSDAEWSPLPIAQAIFDIESGVHSYVVEAKNGIDAPIHVVKHSSGQYLRSNHDATSLNNLDKLDSILLTRLPNYIDNYPDNHKSDWSEDLQGVSHSSDHWFFTQKLKLLKFHVSTDLNSNQNATVIFVGMPTELVSAGCDHFGDPDYREVNGQGYIFVPVEGDNECNAEPRLAVFRDDDQLTYIGASVLSRQNSQNNTQRAGWCAFSPIDQLLYSSFNRISESKPVFRYRLDFDALEQGLVLLQPESDLILHGDNGAPVSIGEYIQGGCFSPEGILYICNGKQVDNENDGGIRAFLPSGEYIYKSSTTREPFKYEYHSGIIHRQEPEGITYWNIDSLPVGIESPNITGQLHAILLNNDAIGGDAIYFKHYSISFL